jgi:hypothetical protein
MAWASKPLGTSANEVIAAVRTGITIESIATSRAKLVIFQKCDWRDSKNKPDVKEFDHVPVVEGDQIVAVYDRAHDAIRELSEDMFMAADASLLSFVEKADTRKFALLVREGGIVAIVTLADIQKLPVYCVLYSLLMSVEMLLMELIRKACQGEPDKWMDHLNQDRAKNDKAKKGIEGYWKVSEEQNVALDKLSCANFEQELTAALGLKLISSQDKGTLERLNKLRNLVCHGKEIALSAERALEIPAHVRDAVSIQIVLDNYLNGSAT